MVFDEGSHSCEDGLEPESDHDHSSSNSAETHVSTDTRAEANDGDSEVVGKRRPVEGDSPQGTVEHDSLQLLESVITTLRQQLTTSGDEGDRLKTENTQLKQALAQSSQEIKKLQREVEVALDLLQVRCADVCAKQATGGSCMMMISFQPAAGESKRMHIRTCYATCHRTEILGCSFLKSMQGVPVISFHVNTRMHSPMCVHQEQLSFGSNNNWLQTRTCPFARQSCSAITCV